MEELVRAPLGVQSELMRSGELSPVELLDGYLDRIRQFDPILHSFITVTESRARLEAKRSEDEMLSGHWRGPLHGIPYGVKDQLDASGAPTTLAWEGLANDVARQDATVIARMGAAGAVLIGKHNLDQLGKGGATTFDYGRPSNPWKPGYETWGSSSGSAVAVAAGLCSVALGEDTGGSVRLPAAAQGLVGLRPTFGRVSRHGGRMYGWTADTVGPLARSVEDVASITAAISGYDPSDSLTAKVPVPAFHRGMGESVDGMRVGVLSDFLEVESLDPQVGEAFSRAVEGLADAGAQIGTAHLPLARYSVPLLMMTSDSDVANGLLRLWLRERYAQIDRGIRVRLAAAAILPAAAYDAGMRGRALIRKQVLDEFGRFDVLLCPTAPGLPQLCDREFDAEDPIALETRILEMRMFTYPFSLSNVPALSIPNGFSAEGLPISLQVIGAPFDEATVFRVAQAIETMGASQVRDLPRFTRGESDSTPVGGYASWM